MQRKYPSSLGLEGASLCSALGFLAYMQVRIGLVSGFLVVRSLKCAPRIKLWPINYGIVNS